MIVNYGTIHHLIVSKPGSVIDLSLPAKESPKYVGYGLQLERFEVFRAQDEEKGHFDTAVEIGGKVLRVHKYFLASASETFNAMLAARWNRDNPGSTTLKIENPEYTYEDVYELMTFIYSGTCKMTNENIYTFTDMAEYYGIGLLKEKCSDFLSEMEMNVGDLDRIFEIANRYSLKKLLESLKGSIKKFMNLLINGEQILGYNKSFVEYMSTVEKNGKMEEEFFDAAHAWARHQSTKKAAESNDNEFDCEKCVQDALKGILCNLKFSQMSLKFVQESILKKRSLFTPKELYEIILKAQKNADQEDECFETLYEVAKDVAVSKQAISKDNAFDIERAIKNELAEVLPTIKFHHMSINFLMDFVVEKGFKISFSTIYSNLLSKHKDRKEEVFKTVYNLAEKQLLKEQKSSPVSGFILAEAVKKRLAGIISTIKFYYFRTDFWTEFGFSRGFYLTPLDLRCYSFVYDDFIYEDHEERLFKRIFNLVQKQALHKQKASTDKNFNLHATIQQDMAEVHSVFNFSHMKLDFLLEFVVGKGYLLSPTVLRGFFLKRRLNYGSDEDSIKAVYKLAEKQAMEKQARSNDKNFSLLDAIKADLAETIPIVQFNKMTKNFLNDFVVKNGIISADQAQHIFYARLEIQSDDTTISGVFDDVFGILKGIPEKGYFNTPRTWHTFRCTSLKFKVPSTPSSVQKMVGAEWFLCLEKDGVLAVKFHDKIKRGEDYLLAEMKTTSDFMFDTTKLATLTASYNIV